MNRTGIIITIIWLSLGIAFPFIYASNESLCTLKVHEWGAYFAGVVAPLTFLWLIIGHFYNQKDSAQHAQILIQHHSELERQAKSIENLGRIVQESHAEKKEIEKRSHQPVLFNTGVDSAGARFEVKHFDATNVTAHVPKAFSDTPIKLADIARKGNELTLKLDFSDNTQFPFDFFIEYYDENGQPCKSAYKYENPKSVTKLNK